MALEKEAVEKKRELAAAALEKEREFTAAAALEKEAVEKKRELAAVAAAAALEMEAEKKRKLAAAVAELRAVAAIPPHILAWAAVGNWADEEDEELPPWTLPRAAKATRRAPLKTLPHQNVASRKIKH